MKRVLALACLSALGAASLFAGPLEDLAARVSPKLTGRVSFRIDPARKDIAVTPSAGGAFTVVAPDTRLAAAGLGCYLRTVAKAHWSWCGDRLDGAMPAPDRAWTFAPAYPHSLAYNYCTLSYTMAFWDKVAWRAEIDRLALYGFEMPLVQAGLSKVWQLTLRELGYPEERIAAFIPDEAAAAWWNMGNLEGLGGPLSQERIDGDAELGRFIVAEMKALGMKPILQGFVGLMPHNLPEVLSKEAFPDARFVPQGKWVDGFVRPALLDPTTEAFKKIAAIWYKHLMAVYGVTHVDAFGGDLFHEGGRSGGLDVTACAKAVQAAQQTASPGAMWMIQAWGGNPTATLLRGLDTRYAMIEALVRDQAVGHRYGRSFGDVPWLWCELLNFGGNHNLYGGLRMLANLDTLTRVPGAKTLVGFGLLSEGLETNPMFYELFTERFFMPRDWNLGETGLDAWISDYALRRYGICTPGIHRALRLLADSVYAPVREQEGCTESIVCARPGWNIRKASTWSSGDVYYRAADTLRAAGLLLQAAEDEPRLMKSETFRYDLVDVTRQALADLARPLLSRAQTDPAARDAFLEAIRRTDTILALSPRWRFDFYEDRVARVGGKASVAALRRMYTTWSGRRGALNDYANRQLSGLLSGYYLKRWDAFFGTQTNGSDLSARLDVIDKAFPTATLPTVAPVDDAHAIARVKDALAFAHEQHRRWPGAFVFAKGIPWTLNGAHDTVVMPFSVSEFVTDAGVYEVDIQWTHGAHALKIEKVELFEGDTCVASDIHSGYTGVRKENNIYTLKLDRYRTTLDDYILKITASGDNGGNASGTFTIAPR